MEELLPERWATHLATIYDEALDETFNTENHRKRNRMTNIIGFIFFVFLAIVVFLFFRRMMKIHRHMRENQKISKYKLRDCITAFGFLIPNLSGFLIFTTLPVVFSFIIAFTNFDTIMHDIQFVKTF